MNIVNWRDCESYRVHGEALEQALIGNRERGFNQGPRAPRLPCAEGFVFFNHASLAPGDTLETHIGTFEEIYYLISGQGTFLLGDDQYRLRDGDAAYVCAGIAHGMRNEGEVPIEYLVVGSTASGRATAKHRV